jgi:peroxiredoxin
LIFKNQIDLESRMFDEKRGQSGYYLKPRERHRRRNTQSAHERCGGAARGEFCFLGFFNRSPGAFVEISARLGWRQAVRRPQQQPHAEPVLELCDRLGNGRLTDAKLFCRAGERSGIDNPDKSFHRSEPIHVYSLTEWCPFCQLELQALARAQPEIERLGATLVGLSPLPGGGESSTFPLLRDQGCRVAARYRIAFTVPARLQPAYLALSYPNRLKKSTDRWVLPLPATYIIDRSGLVMLSYVDADHTTRLEPAEIIAALTHLRTRAIQAGHGIPDRNNR